MADNAELESFRRQWREEVARRAKQDPGAEQKSKTPPLSEPQERFPPTQHEASNREEEEEEEEEEEAEQEDKEREKGSAQHGHSDITQQVEQLTLGTTDEDAFHRAEPVKEPSSALEHFERAVQREEEGSLGDSLQHYRKAYRVRPFFLLPC